MRKTSLIHLLLLATLILTAQKPVGSWTDHLSYNHAKHLAIGYSEIFASTESAIIVYDSEYGEIKKLSRVNGLTESGISTIDYSKENQTLVIAYTSANIDLMKDNVIYNLPDVKLKYLPVEKEINKIRSKGRYAYIACSFGIVVIDLMKQEIYDTWKPGSSTAITEVYDLTFKENRIYAATAEGVYFADYSFQGLSFYGNWTRVDNLPDSAGEYTCIVTANNKIYVNRTGDNFFGDSVYIIDNECSLFSFREGVFYRSFDPYPAGFILTNSQNVNVYNSDDLLIKTISAYNDWGQADAQHALIDGNKIWIADRNYGLVEGAGMNSFQSLIPNGPLMNGVNNISQGDGRIFISGGGVDDNWNSRGNEGQIFSYENYLWSSEIRNDIKDIMKILPEPGNNSHYFASSWGGGLLEYRGNILVNHFDHTTPALHVDINPGQPVSRFYGLAMDENKNLWITRSGATGNIVTLEPDGNWIVNPLIIDAPIIGDILISRSGYKWIILPGGNGLFILDDNNTPDSFSDDRYIKINVKDTDGNVISGVYTIAEDLDGNIWVGTDQGPAIYYDPDNIFGEDPRALRIKIPRNDGTGLADNLLGTEIVTSIAVDGANRKWIGTSNSGAFLFSPDGTEQILNYNEENSPLLSNTIVSILVEEKSGEIWFGTKKGAISLRGESTTGKVNFNKIYSFPNPVREDFSGNVTITGLMRNTNIKITDVSGNLVYETTSTGGQAAWDLTTYRGIPVSAGVYIVFCSNEDGSVSGVTKILVIK